MNLAKDRKAIIQQLEEDLFEAELESWLEVFCTLLTLEVLLRRTDWLAGCIASFNDAECILTLGDSCVP